LFKFSKIFAGDARLFALIGGLWGVIILFVTPPFQVPDEVNHFYRAYEVSEGHWVSEKRGQETGRELPQSLLAMAANLNQNVAFHTDNRFDPAWFEAEKGRKLQPDHRTFANFPNTALYSPIAYAPQALGIALVRLIDSRPIVLFYAGRLVNALFGVLLVALAIHTFKSYAHVVIVIFFLPMSQFLNASLSPDALILSSSLLLFALIMKLCHATGEQIHREKMAAFLCFGLLILSKPVYVCLGLPLLLAVCRADLQCESRQRQRALLVTLSGFVINAFLLLAWNKVSQGIFNPLRTDVVIDPQAQMKWVIEHPVSSIQLFVTQFYHSVINDYLLHSAVGSLLGWLDTPLNFAWISYHLAIMSVLALVFSSGQEKLQSWIPLKVGSGIAVGSGILLISLAMYASWNPVGAQEVAGFQGRYFIPLIPFFYYALTVESLQLRLPRLSGIIAYAVSLTLLFHALSVIKFRYYG
jgi:uncharacterized membrane protein